MDLSDISYLFWGTVPLRQKVFLSQKETVSFWDKVKTLLFDPSIQPRSTIQKPLRDRGHGLAL